MIPYLLLLMIPALMYGVCVIKHNQKNVILVGFGSENGKYSLAMPAFFLWLLLLLVCRSMEVGRDLPNYFIILQRDASATVANIFQRFDDPIFELFNKTIYSITDNFQWYLVLTSFVSLIPVAHIYCKDKRHVFVKILLFINMSTFWFLFSGIRQAMAIALGVLAFDYLRDGKIKSYIIVTVLASLIHVSAIMIIAMYPLYQVRFKRKHLVFIIGITAIVFVFNRAIFSVLNVLFSNIYDKDVSAGMRSTGAYGSLILFALFAALSYMISDESQMTAEDYGLRNILLAAVWLQCFAPLHNIAMRMNYYFIILIPLAVGKCFTITRKQYAQLAKLAEVVICLFFAFYFVRNLYVSSVTGISALDTFPYIPFWAA